MIDDIRTYHSVLLRQSIKCFLVVAGLLLCLSVGHTDKEHDHSQASSPEKEVKKTEEVSPGEMSIPDVELVNQDGEWVHFYSDLIKDKVVAINFIFTTCTTVCPPMGANFGALQKLMGDPVGKEVGLISVSVDAVVDTPKRLKWWSEKFDAGPGWTLLTGPKQDVDKLLKALKVFTPDKTDHSPFILIGAEAQGKWTRVYGLTPPEKLAEILESLRSSERESARQAALSPDSIGTGRHHPVQPQPGEISPAQKYFTDVTLVNQNGEKMQLYSDLLQGKVVVINSFFSSCKESCPVMLATFVKLQDQLGDRLGRDVHLISVSVDPQTDTPSKLKVYAEQLKAKPGWYFITGEKQNVDWALHKFGQYVEAKENHSNIIIIGNESTGLWKKALGLAKSEEILQIVESILNDKG